VGGIFNRAEFFTIGDALTAALKCEGDCKEGGQIVVSSDMWRIVN
jgi:hypothetical protein